ELMFNALTYDPRKEDTYAVILPVLNEVIDLIHPRAIHIGHDEVARGSRLLPGEEPLPPELFLMDVERVYTHLAQRGVETWMWGDMLISPEEFPGMLRGPLHGDSGYAALRGKIPTDIVICDWHYFDVQTDFPSAKAFADAGHQVLGATWKNARTTGNFSRYMAGIPSGGMGMIATTWFHVQRKEWNIVEDIIKTSGGAFLNPQ
ncbi:MAG: hypothetical protein HZA19_02355, partial [Nitrospirae bacterium]|nr:hypothetical protein [Nitrospirota bacterium]